MRNIKNFQARYNRWKKGERYWDIRGIDLPRYEDGVKTVIADDGSRFNVDPSAIGASNLTVTTPEIQVTAQMPYHLKKREEILSDLWHNPGEIRQGEAPTKLDKFRTFLSNYRNNPIAGNVEQAVEDWQHHRTPMQVAFNNFAQLNPYTAAAAAGGNLLSNDGIKKTFNFIKNGRYGRAALSGLGDLLDTSILGHSIRQGYNSFMNRQWSPEFVQKLYNGATKVKRTIDNVTNKFTKFKNKFSKYDDYELMTDEPEYINRNVQFALPYRRPINTNSNTEFFKLNPPVTQKQIEYINSWKNAVQPNGEIMPSEIISKLRYLKDKYPGIFNGIQYHKRINADGNEVYYSTLRHLYNVAKTAQSSPLPKGYTKQQLVFSALSHDIGELLDRENHAEVSSKLLKELYPDIPKDVESAVANHMSMDMINQNPLTRALHFADVSSGVPYKKGIVQHPMLQYSQENMPTNIGIFDDSNWQEHVTNIINPTLVSRGYEPLDVNDSYDNVRKRLKDILTQDNTFIRGVRTQSRDYDTKKAINNTRQSLSKQLGHPVSDEELRLHMVSTIPPSTGSGRRGQDAIRKMTQSDHRYGSLYYSNSNITGSGYGASDEGGAIYRSTMPIKDSPNMSLTDLWFANDWPLFNTHGTLNTNYIYNNEELQPKPVSPEMKPLFDIIDRNKNITYKDLPRKLVLDEFYKQLSLDDKKYHDDIDYQLKDLGINPTKMHIGLKNKTFKDAKLLTQSSLNLALYKAQQLANLNILDRNDFIMRMKDILGYNASSDTFIRHFRKQLLKTPIFKVLNGYVSYLERFRKKDKNMAYEDINILDYINKKRVHKDTKAIFDNFIKSHYDDNEFKNIMSSGEGYIIESDILKDLSNEVKKIIKSISEDKDLYNRALRDHFFSQYMQNKRNKYIEAMDIIKQQIWSEYIKRNMPDYMDPITFKGKYGYWPKIYTEEYLQHPIIYTTEHNDINNYNLRKNAQHYIFLDKKGKRIFLPQQVKHSGTGGKRMSVDAGDMDPSASHKIYNRGKSVINPI